jgi:probable FeS assembly SUF system protein SufT
MRILKMREGQWVYLERDCEALMVPSAVPFSIPGGTEVQIVQALGGHITVNVRGNLARIDKGEADALGVSLGDIPDIKKRPEGPLSVVDEAAIWAQLKTVYDPEIPVNIAALGLVYNVEVLPKYNQDKKLIGNNVHIQMTLTAPGCGMGPVIIADVESKVRDIDSVTDVAVELVFDPPWDRSMMSEEAKLELGMF